MELQALYIQQNVIFKHIMNFIVTQYMIMTKKRVTKDTRVSVYNSIFSVPTDHLLGIPSAAPSSPHKARLRHTPYISNSACSLR